jgi:putative colanic acid biosynthesis UDP-glucose lipid carrier transferase
MERGTLKIHPHGSPSEISSTWRPWPWSLVKSALDPAVAVAAYLAVQWACDEPFTQDDFILLALTISLVFPSEVPFRRFSGRIAFTLLLAWSRVILGVSLIWAAEFMFDLELKAEPGVTALWLVAAPLAMLLLHWASPRIVPLLWPLYPRTKKVVVVGVNSVALRIAQSITQQEAEGQQFIGYFDDRSADRLAAYGPHCILGCLDAVGDYVKANAIDGIYISLPMASQPRVITLLHSLGDTTASIHFVPDVFVADLIQGRVTTLGGLPVVSVCETPFDGSAGAMKRALDLTLIVASLPVVLPLIILIGALVRVTSPGPVFFRQRRYGLDGKEIVVFKFRTMSTLEDGQRTYKQVTPGDPRVTPLGRILRRTSLDELPQLINVLCGSMSLVGPRPHALAVNEQYRKLIPGYMVRHKVKPGITGWAQVNGCRGGDDLESMRRRTEYDLAYLRSWSLSLDLAIIFQTAKMMLLGDKNAY